VWPTVSRSLTRVCHQPPSIERHLLERAAMFISPMSALKRSTDSGRTASGVRKVPDSDRDRFALDQVYRSSDRVGIFLRNGDLAMSV
jgi:hypothetical protein